MSANKFVQQLLVPALFEHQHVRILAEVFAEISEMHFSADLAALDQPHATRNRAAFNSRLRQSDLLVNLQRAGLNADRFRKARDRVVLLDEHEIDPVPDELASEGKSRRPAADDDYVCIY